MKGFLSYLYAFLFNRGCQRSERRSGRNVCLLITGVAPGEPAYSTPGPRLPYSGVPLAGQKDALEGPCLDSPLAKTPFTRALPPDCQLCGNDASFPGPKGFPTVSGCFVYRRMEKDPGLEARGIRHLLNTYYVPGSA